MFASADIGDLEVAIVWLCGATFLIGENSSDLIN